MNIYILLFVLIQIASVQSFQRQFSDLGLNQLKSSDIMPPNQCDILRLQSNHFKPRRTASIDLSMIQIDKHKTDNRIALHLRVIANVLSIGILLDSLYKIHTGSTIELSMFPFTLLSDQTISVLDRVKTLVITRGKDDEKL
jgi:hypothetical protein